MEGLLERPEILAVMSIGAASLMLTLVYILKTLFPAAPRKVLPIEDFHRFELVNKDRLSHDVCRFTFRLPAGHVLGLKTGQHVSLKFVDPETGKSVQRSYTPVTDDRTIGRFALVVKIYKPCEKFPAGGKMSQHLDSLEVGDFVYVKGPKGHMHYHHAGKFSVKPLGKKHEERQAKQIGMMAGGTGITPMLQILHKIFYIDTDTSIIVKLLYANNTVDDILVRQELDDLAADFPDRFSVWYTVVDAPGDWKYDIGFIAPPMVKKHLLFDDQTKATQFFMCGPPPMLKFASVPALEAAGYSAADWVIF